jgi:large subunit ribosomal protein L18
MKQKRKALSPRQLRQLRSRRRLRGTAARPRLNIFCSLNYVYAQVIDDAAGTTLASASSLKAGAGSPRATIAAAKDVGTRLAQNAKAAGVATVVFDRAGYRYHGRVKALADAARAGGLVF